MPHMGVCCGALNSLAQGGLSSACMGTINCTKCVTGLGAISGRLCVLEQYSGQMRTFTSVRCRSMYLSTAGWVCGGFFADGFVKPVAHDLLLTLWLVQGQSGWVAEEVCWLTACQHMEAR